MRLVIASLRQQTDHLLAPKNLTHAQWVPLLKLSLSGMTTAAELAEASELDASSMSRMLDRLEKKGLLRRHRSVLDRRVIHVNLTPAGQAVVNDIPDVLCSVLNAHLKSFSVAEVRILEAMLKRMLVNGCELRSSGPPTSSRAEVVS